MIKIHLAQNFELKTAHWEIKGTKFRISNVLFPNLCSLLISYVSIITCLVRGLFSIFIDDYTEWEP